MASEDAKDPYAGAEGMTPAERDESEAKIEGSIGGLVRELIEDANIQTLFTLKDWLERQESPGFDYEFDKVKEAIDEIEAGQEAANGEGDSNPRLYSYQCSGAKCKDLEG